MSSPLLIDIYGLHLALRQAMSIATTSFLLCVRANLVQSSSLTEYLSYGEEVDSLVLQVVVHQSSHQMSNVSTPKNHQRFDRSRKPKRISS